MLHGRGSVFMHYHAIVQSVFFILYFFLFMTAGVDVSTGERFGPTPSHRGRQPGRPASPQNHTTGRPAQHYTGRPSHHPAASSARVPAIARPSDPTPRTPPGRREAVEPPQPHAAHRPAAAVHPAVTHARDSGNARSPHELSLHLEALELEALGPVTSNNAPTGGRSSRAAFGGGRVSLGGSPSPAAARTPIRTSGGPPSPAAARTPMRTGRAPASPAAARTPVRTSNAQPHASGTRAERPTTPDVSTPIGGSTLQSAREAQRMAAHRLSIGQAAHGRFSADASRHDSSGSFPGRRSVQALRAAHAEHARVSDLGVFHENIRLNTPPRPARSAARPQQQQQEITPAPSPARSTQRTPATPPRAAARRAAAPPGGASGCGARGSCHSRPTTPARARLSQGGTSGSSTPLRHVPRSPHAPCSPAPVRCIDPAPAPAVRAGLVRATVEKFRHAMPGCGVAMPESGGMHASHAYTGARSDRGPETPSSVDSGSIQSTPVGRSRVAQTASRFARRMHCTGEHGALSIWDPFPVLLQNVRGNASSVIAFTRALAISKGPRCAFAGTVKGRHSCMRDRLHPI